MEQVRYHSLRKEMRPIKARTQLVISLCVASVLVSTAVSQKVATSSMQFLKVMPCARATALGDAYTALASGAEAVFWNPSGVALVRNPEFSTTYIVWIFDARQGAFSYATPLGDIGALGVQIQYVDYGKFEEAVLYAPDIKSLPYPGLTGREFHPYSYLVGVTYAKSLTERFSTGLTFKFAHESLYDQSSVTVTDVSKGIDEQVNTYGNAYLFDFGMRYNTGFRSIQVAAAVQNFGPDIKYALEKNHGPMLFRVGATADLLGPNSLLLPLEDSRLGVAFDLFQPNDYNQQAHMGMEYEYAHVLALRVGYKYNYDSEGMTFGVGLRQTFSGMKIVLDYSYGSLGTYLGGAHRLSLGVGLL
jgi:hypothetical protein